ncbi:MAG: folate-binding protein [Nibricoccus sp.]
MAIPTSSVVFSFYRPASVLKIQGEDAFSFLQGQLTQDLKPCLNGPEVAYGLFLTHKGKVQGDGFVMKRGEEWICVSLFSEAARLKMHLEAFVIADDVRILDETALWQGATVIGENAEAMLADAGLRVESGKWVEGDRGFVFAGRRSGQPAWEFLYPLSGDALPERLRQAGAQEISPSELERLRVLGGIPRIPKDLGPEDLPNEGGLDEIAVSYTKGCYIGQEVMARLKSMGQVRRRLARVEGASPLPAELPAALFADGKRVGELRSAVARENGFVGLAMISLLGMTGTRFLSFSPEGELSTVVSHEG